MSLYKWIFSANKRQSQKQRSQTLSFEVLEDRTCPIVGSGLDKTGAAVANAATFVRPGSFNYTNQAGQVVDLSGVVEIIDTTGTGSGALIQTVPTAPGAGAGPWFGSQILTVAHNNPQPAKVQEAITFNLEGNGNKTQIVIQVPPNAGGQTYQVNDPNFKIVGYQTPDGTPRGGHINDVAIYRLTDQKGLTDAAFAKSSRLLVPPKTAMVYGLYTSAMSAATPEVGQNITLAGYGKSGIGANGDNVATDHKLRAGENTLDALFNAFNKGAKAPNNQADANSILLDFDGKAGNPDPLGFFKTVAHAGLGFREAFLAPGDSGGPAFIGSNLIAGVISLRIKALPSPPDINGATDSSFGEIGRVMKVSSLVADPATASAAIRTAMGFDGMNNPIAYDIVLDMNQQVAGLDQTKETLTITASEVNGFLQLNVTGSKDATLNGLYYTAPVANIKTLTIRGSTSEPNAANQDDYKFVIANKLKLAGDDGAGKNALITLDGGKGNDEFIIGDANTGNLDGWTVPIKVVGGPGASDRLIVNDVDTDTNQTYTITDAQITRNPGAVVTKYTNVERVTVSMGRGDDTVTVQSTHASVTNAYDIYTGNGNDTITIGTWNNQKAKIWIDGQGDGGAGERDQLLIDDSASGNPHQYELAKDATTNNWNGQVSRDDKANAVIYYRSTEKVTLNTGADVDTVTMKATSQSVSKNYFINTSAGNDEITLGIAAADGLNLFGTTPKVYVDGGAGTDNKITFEDSKSGARHTYTVGPDTTGKAKHGQVKRDDLPEFVFFQIQRVTLNTGSVQLGGSLPDDTVNINATSATVTKGYFINTFAGADKVVVGSSAAGAKGLDDALNAKIFIDGGGATVQPYDWLYIDDRNAQAIDGAPTQGRDYKLSAAAGWDGQVQRNDRAASPITYKDMESMEFFSTPRNDTVAIDAASKNVWNLGYYIRTGDGTDAVTVGSAGQGLAEIPDAWPNGFGAVLVNGGAGGDDTLTVDDSASKAMRTYDIRPDSTSWAGDGEVKRDNTEPIVHYDVEKVTLKAGNAKDTIKVLATNVKVTNGTFILSGGGGDEITIGDNSAPNKGLDKIATFVQFNTGNDQANQAKVVIDDAKSAAKHDYIQSKTSLKRDGVELVKFDAVADKFDLKVMQSLQAGNTFKLVAWRLGNGLDVVGGDGADVFTVSSNDNKLDGIDGIVTFKGGTGNDQVVFSDTGYANGDNYYLNKNTFAYGRSAALNVTYTEFESLGLNTGAGTDKIVLTEIPDPPITVALDGGNAGDDRVVVEKGTVSTPQTTFANLEIMEITGGKLSLGANLTFETLIQSGGELTGGSNFTMSKQGTWSGGTMSGAGSTIVDDDATLDLTGSALHTLTNRSLSIVGTTNWNGVDVVGSGGTVRTEAGDPNDATDFGGKLAGGGSLAGALVNAGQFHPGGDNQAGTFTVNGNFTQESTGTLFMEFDGGGASDKIVVNGTVTLDGDLSTASLGGQPVIAYLLIDNDATDAVNNTFAGVAEGDVVAIGANNYKIRYAAGTGPNDVVLNNSDTNNTNPVAVNDSTVLANVASIAVLTNDYDPDFDPLTLTNNFTQGAVGTVAINADGVTFAYTRNVGDNSASDTFTYEISDGNGGTATATVTIDFNNGAPTDITLSGTSVPENQPVGTLVGYLGAVDPNAGDTFAFALVAGGGGGADNGSFTIVGNQLRTAASFDFEAAQNTYNIRVVVTDAGGATFPKNFTINVTNVNEAPTDITLSANSVDENAAIGTVVGNLGAADPDAGDTFTFVLVNLDTNFTIVGNQLKTNAELDYEAQSVYSVRVRVTDAGGLSFEKVFTIIINPVDETPTDCALDDTDVDENVPVGTTVGNFSATDPDVGDTFTYDLVAGAGDTDNASFTIVGNELRTAAAIDFETQPTYSIRVRVTDAGGLTFEKVFTVTVNGLNDAPVDTLPPAQTTAEDTDLVFSTANGNAISVADQDAGTGSIQVTLTAGNGTLTLSGTTGLTFLDGTGTGDFTMTFLGTVADINAALNGMAFSPTPGFNGSASVQIVIDDQGNTGPGGPMTATDTVAITVESVSDAPAGADNTVTALEDGSYAFSLADFGFSDLDDSPSDAFIAVKITTLPGAGALTRFGIAVNSGDVISAMDIAAGALVFTPASNANGAGYASFTFQVQDDGGTANGGADLDPTPNTMTIDVTSVNDAPAGTDNTVTTVEDVAYIFTAADFGLTDSDDSPANGLLAVQITTVPVFGVLTLDGVPVNAGDFVPVSSIDFGALVFTSVADASGASYATFTFKVQDDGGTDNGGVDLDPTLNLLTINVTAVNDEPAGADRTLTVTEDGSYTLTAFDFGFSDGADSPANSLQAVEITTVPASGTLTLSGSAVAPGTFISASDINLGRLVFTPAANANGSPYASFTFQVQDDGGTANGGVDLDATPNTMSIDVTAVNDAPVNTVPGSQTTYENAALVFSSGNGNAISIADSDAGSASVQINLSAMYGKLTLSGTGGLSFTVGDGVDDTMMIFTGAIDAVNAALDGLSLAPAHQFSMDWVYISTNDQGNTGSGGALSDFDSVSVTVNAVNDAPAGADATRTFNEDTSYTLLAMDFGFTDPNDSPGNALQAVKITTVPGSGSLTLNGSAVSAGTIISVGDINSWLLVFTPPANANGSPYASFTFQVQDDGGTANGGVDLDPSPNTLTFNVSAVDDAPVNTVPGKQGTAQNTDLVFSSANGNGVSVADIDAGTSQVQITLMAMNGTLTLSGTTGLSFSMGDGTNDASMTFTGTLANVNAALDGLIFTPNANFHGYGSVAVMTNDQGNTGSGGPLFDSDTITVAVDAGSIGNRVWNDANQNGIQDAGESGISGVSVNLLDEYGGWLASTTTDNNGYYVFDNLVAGNYKIRFMAPANYTFTSKDQGSDDALDSDADSQGYTGVFALNLNQDKDDVDAGLFSTGSGGSGGSGGGLS